MIVFLVIIFAIIAGLLISLIMPGFSEDINVGFYLIITALFTISALIIMFRKRFSFFGFMSTYVAIFLSIFILAEGALIYFSANDIPSGNEQAIIVAGSGLFVESRLSVELENRLDVAIDIYSKNTHLPIILSGGTNENHTLPVCVAMQTYIEKKIDERGLEMPVIITEDKSVGIFENIDFSLKKSDISSAYVIVSRHNVARTKLLCSRLSPVSTVIGADYPASKYVVYYIREFGYTIKSVIFDGII